MVSPGPIWQRQWDLVTPAFAYPPAIRKILTTTNAIEKPAHAAAEDHQDPGALPHG